MCGDTVEVYNYCIRIDKRIAYTFLANYIDIALGKCDEIPCQKATAQYSLPVVLFQICCTMFGFIASKKKMFG